MVIYQQKLWLRHWWCSVTLFWNRQTVQAGRSTRDHGHLPWSLSTDLEASSRWRRKPNPPLRRRGAGRGVKEVGEVGAGHGWHALWSSWPGTWQTLQVPRQGRQLWGREWTSRQRQWNTRQRSVRSVNLNINHLLLFLLMCCVLFFILFSTKIALYYSE